MNSIWSWLGRTGWWLLLAVRGFGEAPGAADSPAAALFPAGGRDYVLQPLDRIQVRIHNDATLDREVRISRESRVNLPLIGAVDLRGRTVAQAEAVIRELYDRDYLVNPQVNLRVTEYARRTVNVLGAVMRPGEIEFPREESITLLGALTRAGGLNRLADRKRVRLTRFGADGRGASAVIDVTQLIGSGRNGGADRPLEVGDVIFVPERISWGLGDEG